MVHLVVELDGGTVVVARVVVVAGRAVVVVEPARVVVVAPARVVAVARGVVVDVDVGDPTAGEADASPAPPMWKVTSTVLERTSLFASLGGMVSGAVPATTYAVSVVSMSVPKSTDEFVQTADTSRDPSSWRDGLTTWKRLARLTDGPPRALPVLLSPTTNPGNAGLCPGLAAGAGEGRAPPRRNSAGRTVGSVALNLRATTIPRPPAPCTEAGSGESTFATTGVVGKRVVDVASKSNGEVVGTAPSPPPPLHDAKRTAANPTMTSRRSMPDATARTMSVASTAGAMMSE